MIALVRSRMTSHRTVPATEWPIVEQCRVQAAAAATVRLTAWTRDEVVGAVLSHAASAEVAMTTAGDATYETLDIEEHLLADSEETETSWLSIADVIVRDEGLSGEQQLSSIFSRFPGCLIACILGPGNVCAMGSRDGWSARVVGRPVRGKATHVYGWYASFAHVWRTSGRSLATLADAYVTVAVETNGRREHTSYGWPVSVIGSHP
jgi:hypothetical protein